MKAFPESSEAITVPSEVGEAFNDVIGDLFY